MSEKQTTMNIGGIEVSAKREKPATKVRKKDPDAPKKEKGPKIRLMRREALGVHWPKRARLLIEDLTKETLEAGRVFTSFSVPTSPLSLNHQYFHKFFPRKSKRGNVVMTPSKALKPEVLDFRAIVKSALRAAKVEWRAPGTSAAIILFESPVWLTAEHRVRKQDCDNLVKPLFDAIELGSGVRDECHWEFHVFKVVSKRVRTIVYLFDLGDVVEFFN
jgi:Holliday junction resolvase RusA-like endonuclease